MTKRLLAILCLLLALPSLTWAAASVANHTVASTTGAGSLTTSTFTATAGNTIVAVACLKANGSISLSTSGADTETLISSDNTPALNTMRVSYFQNIAGGAGYSVTMTPGGGTPAMALVIVELAGVTTTPFDKSAVANVTPAATTHSAGPTATLTQADEIAIAAICSDSTSATATLTQDTGWTLSDSQLDGSTKIAGAIQYKVLAATTAVTSNWTTDSTTGRNTVSTFIASGGGGGATVHNRTLVGVGQ